MILNLRGTLGFTANRLVGPPAVFTCVNDLSIIAQRPFPLHPLIVKLMREPLPSPLAAAE